MTATTNAGSPRRSALILATQSNLGIILQADWEMAIPEGNRQIMRTMVPLGALVPLTWKLELEMENISDFDLARLTCAVLHCRDQYLAIKQRFCQRRQDFRCIGALPGDFIVIQPIEPFKMEFPNTEAILAYLRDMPVCLVYVGETLPADVDSHYRDLVWEKFCVAPPVDLYAEAQRNVDVSISVFDVLRTGASVAEAESLGRQWGGATTMPLPGLKRSEVNYPALANAIRRKLKLPANTWMHQVSAVEAWVNSPFDAEAIKLQRMLDSLSPYDRRMREHWQGTARRSGSMLKDRADLTVLDWYKEHNRQHWKVKAYTLGSSLRDRADLTADNWYEEYKRCYWKL